MITAEGAKQERESMATHVFRGWLRYVKWSLGNVMYVIEELTVRVCKRIFNFYFSIVLSYTTIRLILKWMIGEFAMKYGIDLKCQIISLSFRQLYGQIAWLGNGL